MECLETWLCRKRITGSIKKPEIMALGITNNKTENWLILAISIMALQDLQRVFPKKHFIWELVSPNREPKSRVRSGAHGMENFLMATIHATSFG